MQERSVTVDPSTVFHRVLRYAPELEKRMRWYQDYRSTSWHVDETYIKVGGEWQYLFRAADPSDPSKVDGSTGGSRNPVFETRLRKKVNDVVFTDLK